MLAYQLARALDGKPDGYHSWRCECPCHGGHHLRVSDREGKTLLWCFQGATFRELVTALEERGLW